MRLIAFMLALTALAGCGGAGAKFTASCQSMAKSSDYLSPSDRKSFCSCLSTDTKALSAEEKAVWAALMAEAGAAGNLQRAAQDAVADGTLTRAGMTTFFRGLTQCARRQTFAG